MLETLFNKVAELKACNFIKKRLQHRYFPVNIAKLLRAAFFIEHIRWLLLQIVFQVGTSHFKDSLSGLRQFLRIETPLSPLMLFISP